MTKYFMQLYQRNLISIERKLANFHLNIANSTVGSRVQYNVVVDDEWSDLIT